MYTVEYIFKSKRFTETITGTENDIRQLFLKEGKKIINMSKQYNFFNKVTKAEIIATFIAMSDMLNGQEKLEKALTAIIQSFKKDSPIVPILIGVRENIHKGKQLSVCLEAYKDTFGITAISMIQAGESAGKLPETLITVANHIRSIEEAKGNLIKQLIQPIISLSIGIFGLMVSTMYIIPKITQSDLYKLGNKAGSPEPMSIFIMKQLAWITPTFIVLAIATIIAGIVYYKQNQEEAEKILLRTPFIKELIFYRSYYVAFSSLSNLLKVGVRVNEAIKIVGKSQQLKTLQNEFKEAIYNINNGLPFGAAFKNINTIERTILEVAQKEDSIQNNFNIIANRFYGLYMEMIKGIAPKMQVTVIILIVSLVCLMFMGIMVPYFSVIQNLKG